MDQVAEKRGDEVEGVPYIVIGDNYYINGYTTEYNDAIIRVRQMEKGDVLVIVGVSFYTAISNYLRELAEYRGVDVYILNDCATEEVPEICNRLLHDGYVGMW